MLVVTRFRVPETEAADFRGRLQTAVEVLGRCRGFVAAQSGRNIDEPELWVLVTTWQDVGSYRRALSSYDVKVGVVPLLAEAVDEPSAYETFGGEPGAELNVNSPRSLG